MINNFFVGEILRHCLRQQDTDVVVEFLLSRRSDLHRRFELDLNERVIKVANFSNTEFIIVKLYGYLKWA
ncbi:hypothetical protein LWI28_017525 [Acer negundo]|uniref:Uncharacterized protein n=1 Tax=Acer negundo TaxID=4023 RepID=A0AAD5IZV7_ACENE|nr:hypothetical protein LWI28_017525 [Acer negundo]